jgi:superfamily II DNA or RNA helicase
VSTLRDYQQDALDALYAGWRGGLQRIGVSLPTGVGKTHIMAHTAKVEAEARYSAERVLFLLHRDTLIEQTVAKLRATLNPTTSIGVVKAERNQLGARVIVASVHSLRTAKRRAQLPPIGLCIVDEAHVSVSPTYRAVFDQIGAYDPAGARLAGFTATWSRSDSTGLGDVWQDVVYHKSIKWATKNGFLVKPRGIRVGAGVDVSGAKISRMTGDYAEADLERVVMLEDIRDAVVKGVLRHRGSRPGVLFAPTVASAEFFGDALREAGVRTAGWYGTTAKGERHRIDQAIRSGGLDMMTTCTAVAEGYDNPQLAFGVFVRPTKHEGLFVQMAGRFLRPWPGKTDALLLDCVGLTEDVHLRTAIDLSVTSESVDGEPDEPLDYLDEPDEPVGREHMARVRAEDSEVELFAGTQVQWLTSAVGVPFVGCGDQLVFLVEGPAGTWNVGQTASRMTYGKPAGHWVAEGLSQEDALLLASDHAEDLGEHLSRRSSAWRTGKPSEAQMRTAHGAGLVVPEGSTRGQLSDWLSITFANRVLSPFAAWSKQWKEYEAV